MKCVELGGVNCSNKTIKKNCPKCKPCIANFTIGMLKLYTVLQVQLEITVRTRTPLCQKIYIRTCEWQYQPNWDLWIISIHIISCVSPLKNKFTFWGKNKCTWFFRKKSAIIFCTRRMQALQARSVNQDAMSGSCRKLSECTSVQAESLKGTGLGNELQACSPAPAPFIVESDRGCRERIPCPPSLGIGGGSLVAWVTVVAC